MLYFESETVLKFYNLEARFRHHGNQSCGAGGRSFLDGCDFK